MTWWQTLAVKVGTALVNAVIAGEQSKGRAVILSGRLIIQDERGKVVAGAEKPSAPL